MYFYVGIMATRIVHGTSIIRVFFLLNVVLMTLQKLNLAGGILSGGYQSDVSDRVQGIASFPSEMGLLLNLIFCYLIYDDNGPSKWVKLFPSPATRQMLRRLYPYGMFCLFGIFIIFTGNRISIAALVICFLFRLKQEFRFRSLYSWATLCLLIPLVVLGSVYLISQTAGVYERSLALFSMKNVELIETVWDKIDIAQDPFRNEMAIQGHYDLSWWLRIHKWLFAIKTFVLNPECYLQGLGPGFCGAALDGGLLRIVVEYGMLGAFAFWKFFASLYRINLQTKWMMIVFAINMIFFDAYLAYKTMSLLFFACGSTLKRGAEAPLLHDSPLRTVRSLRNFEERRELS